MNYTQRNKSLGLIREKRVKEFITKIYKWKIIKTNTIIDQYHAIDFIAHDQKGKLIMIQVKGTARLKNQFEPKAVKYAQFHNAALYYFYISNRYNSKIYIKKVI